METKHIPEYWERHGTRRPFPSLYKAVQMYGRENVYFEKPIYEKDNQCPWCGGEVNNKRRRFCSDDCRQSFENATVWQRGRDPYSLRMLYRDNFTCQECGEFHALINDFGMPLPIDDGEIEVHHIVAVADGGGDEAANLTSLCVLCHKKKTAEWRVSREEKQR